MSQAPRKALTTNFGDVNIVTGTEFEMSGEGPPNNWHRHDCAVVNFMRNGILSIHFEERTVVTSSEMIVYIPAGMPTLQFLVLEDF
jgi:mannose-6-phosphate isomerase-like protein (cupin superfamily)